MNLNENHALRSNEKVQVNQSEKAYTKYGDITFKIFCGKIIANITNLNFYENFLSLKNISLRTLTNLLKKLINCTLNLI